MTNRLLADLRASASPLLCLTWGFFEFSVGLYGALYGRVRGRYSGWVYRADQPKKFWSDVVTSFLAGLVMIGYSLYLASRT